MHIQVLKSGVQRTTAFLVSCMMVASLAFPVTTLATDSTDANEQNISPTSLPSSAEPIKDSSEAPVKPSMNQQPSWSESQSTAPLGTSATQAPSSSEADTQQSTESLQPHSTTPSSTTSTLQSGEPQMSTNVDATAPSTQTTAETGTSLSNTIDSSATSGNATAHQNTTVGNVTTGNAAALATIVNLLQSNVNLNGAQPITFIQDVTGSVNGDIIVDPDVIASLNTTSPLFGNNTASSTIDTSTQASIANTINISATSGNANATQNTTAGNVQSGSANAVANVVNIINSAINANQSFIGMINIYGNLQGNILVPEAFVNSVLGTGANTPTANGPIITSDNNSSVINNVTTTAHSGSASATDNSNVGTVATGQADTNVTILNLTSNQTVGKNALLVFVNVMGNWVGLILDAPVGTTSASLGGGTTQGTETALPDTNTTNNYQVTNNINASAQSGSAQAHENTTVGNVQSGNASAGVNLVNILNSQISLSEWFGILFINVFGTWNGNFGVQTAVTTPPTGTGNGGGSSAIGGSNNPSASSPTVFRFVPSNQRNYTMRTLNLPAVSSIYTQDASAVSSNASQQAVLGASNASGDSNDKHGINLQNSKDKVEEQSLRWWLLSVLLLLIALLAARYYTVRRRTHQPEEL